MAPLAVGKKKKRKVILPVILLVVFLFAIGILYLNNVFLPTTIKSLIVSTLHQQTQKEITIESLRFNLLKGLIIRNVTISDQGNTLLFFKEASCGFLFNFIFKKAVIIPSVTLRELQIYAQRRKDGTFNLSDLYAGGKTTQASVKNEWSVIVRKVTIIDGNVSFYDQTFSPVFTKSAQHINALFFLSLPAQVKGRLSCDFTGAVPMSFSASGEYDMVKREWQGKAMVKNISPQEFSSYYNASGINVSGGTVDAECLLKGTAGGIAGTITSQQKQVTLNKNTVTAAFTSQIKNTFQYDFSAQKMKSSGILSITDAGISGIPFVENIDNITGEVAFDEKGISTKGLTVQVAGFLLKGAGTLTNYTAPKVTMDISSELDLAAGQKLAKEKFQFELPGQITGTGDLQAHVEAAFPLRRLPRFEGTLAVDNAIFQLTSPHAIFEQIRAKIGFNLAQLQWDDASFRYQGTTYMTKGVVTQFKNPVVLLDLSAADLALQANVAAKNKSLKINRCVGRYLNSTFFVSGTIDTSTVARPHSVLSGRMKVSLEDLRKPLGTAIPQLQQLQAQGIVSAGFKVDGNLGDFRSCSIDANLSSPSVSIYGLKANALQANYTQEAGVIALSPVTMGFYAGTINGLFKMNLNSENLPYAAEFAADNVQIDKLKLDTPGREQELAGTIRGEVKINGFGSALEKMTGAGKIFITGGKLWQLNLFKGLGQLIFAKDFANIIFEEGSCAFTVKDKFVFSDNVKLKSNITNLEGKVKIGFDTTIEAALNVEVLDQMAPQTGTFKDITTAIVGQAGTFGVIKIAGTLSQPKYKFQTAVVDIIKGITDVIFGSTQ
ncbi:MAG: AsmA family protein [Candidatus Omnitrophica bacterium]|nr:AsmA family protein [Candidatus Omnitrophota bacterium]